MAPKKKQEKMSLGAFLGDDNYGAGGTTSWADEMDDMPMPSETRSGYGSERREYSKPSFGGDRDFGGGERNYATRESLPMPTKPPYTAHLGNLSFDVTTSDIQDFFSACSVTNVRIVEDKLDRKPKGFGYVEFGSVEGLKKALELNNTQFQARNVRISIAEPPKDRGETRELNDWTRKGPLPSLPANERRPSERSFGAERSFGSGREMGSDFNGERSSSRRGDQFGGEGDGKQRDFSNWERKGPMSPSTSGPPSARMEGGGDARRSEMSFERRGSPASWGEGREPGAFQAPRPSRSERPAIPEREPTAAEQDSQWRAKMRPDAPTPSATATPDASTPSSPAAAAPAAPATRQRLNLSKRTVSEAPQADSNAPSSDSKASPFGAARPIDTTARDKAIEEKRIAQRAQKEEEDKIAAEKRAAEKAEKIEKQATQLREPREPRDAREPREKVTSPNGTNRPQRPAQGGPEGLDADSKPRNFQILQRLNDQENGEDAATGTENETNGTNDDGARKNPELDVPQVAAVDGEAGANAADGEGWEEVTAGKQKGNKRGGRAGGRA